MREQLPPAATNFTRGLGIRHPILQSGMGGVAGVELAVAVSEAGAGGVLALYKYRPDEIAQVIRSAQERTQCNFGLNLIPEVSGVERLHRQLRAACETARAGVFMTFFGVPDPTSMEILAQHGMPAIVQVGTSEEAATAIELGAFAVVVQGDEAGGHLLGLNGTREIFEGVSAIAGDTPVLVAGGVADGDALMDWLSRGAAGCLCGTVFVATQESLAHEHFKERIVTGKADDTVITDLFHWGWPSRRHRVLRNAVTESEGKLPARFIAKTRMTGREYPIPRYSAATCTVQTTGRVEEMAMYCGVACEGINRIRPAADVVRNLMKLC